MLHTAVLLLAFNRPAHTQKVLEVLHHVQPTRLYLAADGARPTHPTDELNCAAVKQVLSNIPWQCEVKTLYHTQNLGCKTAVTQALNWFFTHEPHGIVLEDDCMPHPSFFGFCEELLHHHQHNPQITHIAGYNPLKSTEPPQSYFYTNIPLVWGWATWRRAWAQFTPITPETLAQTPINFGWLPTMAAEYLKQKFWQTAHKKNNSWAYSWTFTQLKNGGLCIVPKKNLVQNIGFDETATHTQNKNRTHTQNPAQRLETPIIHPLKAEINQKLAMEIFYKSQKTKLRLIIWNIKRQLFK